MNPDEVDELAPEVLDGIVGPLGGTAHRYPAARVLTEMEAADDGDTRWFALSTMGP